MSRDINLLQDKMKELTLKLIDECKKQNIDIIVTCTYRGEEEQNKMKLEGKSNASFGYSFHNYGYAIDICPVTKINGQMTCLWNDSKLFDKIGLIGESIGLSWSGRWKGKLQEKCHFQYQGKFKDNESALNYLIKNKKFK